MARRTLRIAAVTMLAVLAVVLFPGCGTTPYTQRSQLLLLPESQEIALGLQAYQDEVQGQPMSRNQAWVAMVENAGRRIAAAAEGDGFGKDYAWEFQLIASSTVNAFALPGGKVAFYEGIMPVCQDETGVAVVMGHEIGHAIARHGGERISSGLIAEVGIQAVNAYLSGSNNSYGPLISQALGAGAGVGMLKFSRDHESEADHIGLLLMAKAGYDPREAPRFWTRMGALSSGARSPEFLSTHPSPDTRVSQLEAWMPEALEHFQN